MKKMSQKTVKLLVASAFMFIGSMSIFAQNTSQGIVIIDDVSGVITPVPEAKSMPPKISVQGSKITFKGVYVLSGATTVTTTIIDPSTNTKVVKTSYNIQNTTYSINDFDVSMLEENKWYNINVSFNGTTPASQNGQIRRVVSKPKTGAMNNN